MMAAVLGPPAASAVVVRVDERVLRETLAEIILKNGVATMNKFIEERVIRKTLGEFILKNGVTTMNKFTDETMATAGVGRHENTGPCRAAMPHPSLCPLQFAVQKLTLSGLILRYPDSSLSKKTVEAPLVVVEYVQPASVVDFVAPAPAITCATPAPVVEYVAPPTRHLLLVVVELFFLCRPYVTKCSKHQTRPNASFEFFAREMATPEERAVLHPTEQHGRHAKAAA